VTATLADLDDAATGLTSPALVVVGEVVSVAGRIAQSRDRAGAAVGQSAPRADQYRGGTRLVEVVSHPLGHDRQGVRRPVDQLDLDVGSQAEPGETAHRVGVVLDESDDRRRSGGQRRERDDVGELPRLELGVERPPVRAAVGR
jgi:hypothetical protein